MTRLFISLLATTAFLFAGEVAPVPEPSTYLMMGAGLGTLLYLRNRFGKKK
jgi:hypothetical protein